MDFTSLYSTRIQTNFDDDLALILKTFHGSRGSKSDCQVVLTNYYKGLPITYPATILGVDRGNLDLEVNMQQAVAIAADRYTLVRSKLFPHAMVAHVQYVNVKKHIASLNKLSFVEVLAERRAAVRLDMDPLTRFSLECGGQQIAGKLTDISIIGAAALLENRFEFEPGMEVVAKFMLPDIALEKQTEMTVRAIPVSLGDSGAPYRCGLKIFPEKQQEQLISRYSFQRQVEIIRGLKEMAE